MTRRHLINFALAVAIAAILSSGHLLDGPNDTQAAQAQANNLQDAQHAAKADQDLARARKTAGVAL